MELTYNFQEAYILTKRRPDNAMVKFKSIWKLMPLFHFLNVLLPWDKRIQLRRVKVFWGMKKYDRGLTQFDCPMQGWGGRKVHTAKTLFLLNMEIDQHSHFIGFNGISNDNKSFIWLLQIKFTGQLQLQNLTEKAL